ncbi:MAG: HAD hydrolase family protein [Acidimicrobiales bacterium]|nr:HAD hydrolase family protein [Acidimicrobiales bacterium]
MAARRQEASTDAHLPTHVAALVLDFDGVISDDRVLTLQDGTEGVLESCGDGMGLELLRAAGIRVRVLSKEANPVVTARCAKLGLEVFQRVEQKLRMLEQWCDDSGVDVEDIVYVGNDVNDLECIRRAGCGVVPSDAHPSVRTAADVVLTLRRWNGAARELRATRFLGLRLTTDRRGLT